MCRRYGRGLAARGLGDRASTVALPPASSFGQHVPPTERMIKKGPALFLRCWTCASLAGLAFLTGCASAPSTAQKSTGWIKDEVADSYVFGYPLVLMGVARDAAVGT